LTDISVSIVNTNNRELLLSCLESLHASLTPEIAVEIVVLDNASLGMVRQQQDMFWDGRRTAVALGATPDWPSLAASFGLAGYDGDLAAALAAPGPALVRVPIDPESDCLPMFRPGSAVREMIGAPVLGIKTVWSGSR